MTDDATIKAIFESARTIAVVGASVKPRRAGHYVPAYLQEQGYRIVPVNPNYDEVLGERCYPRLRDIPFPVDVVEVFRRPEHCGPVAEEAVAIGAKVLWLQLGIVCDPAREVATRAGLTYVEDACMMPEHRRLVGAA